MSPSPKTPKPAAQADRILQPKLTPEKIEERKARYSAYEREAAKLVALKLKRFAKLDSHDLIAVLALVDLLAHGEHCQCLEAAENWVGAAVFNVLYEVAFAGPVGVNSDPYSVKYAFDQAVEYLRDGLELRRKLAPLPDSVLDYINSTEWQQDHARLIA